MVPTLSGRRCRTSTSTTPPARRRSCAADDAVERLLPYYGSVHRGAGHKARRSARGVRAARGGRRRVRRRRPRPRRRRVHQEHDRGDQQARPVAADRRRRRGADDRARAPLQRPAVAGAGPHGARRRAAGRHARRRRPRPPARPPRRPGRAARRVGRVERHRRRAADPRARRAGCTPPAAGSSSTPPSSPPTGRSTCGPTTIPVTSTSSPCRRTRCTPRSAAARCRRARRLRRRAGPLAAAARCDAVTLDGVAWADLPDREEAGSPNVLGAVALRRGAGHARRARSGPHRRPRADAAALRARRSRAPSPASVSTARAIVPAPTHRRGPVHDRGRRPRTRRRGPRLRARHRRAQRVLLRPSVRRPPARARRRREPSAGPRRVGAGDTRDAPGMVRISLGCYNDAARRRPCRSRPLERIAAGDIAGTYGDRRPRRAPPASAPQRAGRGGLNDGRPPRSGHSASRSAIWSPTFSISRTTVTRSAISGHGDGDTVGRGAAVPGCRGDA